MTDKDLFIFEDYYYINASKEFKESLDTLDIKSFTENILKNIAGINNSCKKQTNTPSEVSAFAQQIISSMQEVLKTTLRNKVQLNRFLRAVDNDLLYIDNITNGSVIKKVVRYLLLHIFNGKDPEYKDTMNRLTPKNKQRVFKEIYAYFVNEFSNNYRHYAKFFKSFYPRYDNIAYNTWINNKK